MKYMAAHKIILNAYTSRWSKQVGNFCTGGQEDTIKIPFSDWWQNNFIHPLQLWVSPVQQMFLSPFSYHTSGQLALQTVNSQQAAAICLVLHWHHPFCRTPYLHPTIKLVYVTYLWTKWGQKTRWLPPQTKMKAGDYFKFNIFFLTITRRIKSFSSSHTRNAQVSQWAHSDLPLPLN